jgi:hypothetical protein
LNFLRIFDFKLQISQTGNVLSNSHRLACVSCFQDLHDGADGGQCGNHPVQYFQESCKYNQEKLNKLATPGRAGDTEMGDAPPKKEMLATDQPMFS